MIQYTWCKPSWSCGTYIAMLIGCSVWTADDVTWWHIAYYSSRQNACIAVNSDKTIITSFATAYVLITGGITWRHLCKTTSSCWPIYHSEEMRFKTYLADGT